MLRSLSLLPVYDSETSDLVRELQVPLLANSVDYLRGVGFFSSGWLALAHHGLSTLVENGGRARIVLSPVLEERDWQALQLGEEARFNDELRSVLTRNIKNLAESLKRDTLNALAWMVADGILEFRFAIPRERTLGGDYHDKVGVFTDRNGDAVAIHGSLNDSVRGSLNGEAFSVFKSWVEGQVPYVNMHRARLTALWENRNRQFRVCRIPEAVREEFIQLRSTSHRPYSLDFSAGLSQSPICPVKLHDYQSEAVKAWFEADCCGVFEMATGAGKTYAALAAAVEQFRKQGRLALLILVPYLHLLDQWGRNCRQFRLDPVQCGSEQADWPVELGSRIQDFKVGITSHLTVLAVHSTAATNRFQRIVRGLSPKDTMVVGDEVHRLGAPVLRQALSVRANLRLGLSATPHRWFDAEGTAAVFSYFGPVCYELRLEDVIGKYLTPYVYNPVLVNLTTSEMRHYKHLTERISRLRQLDRDEVDKEERLKRLLVQRARVLSAASQKLPALVDLVRDILKRCVDPNRVRGILVYCAPGEHRNVLRAISGLGLRCHEFVHTVDMRHREEVLEQFSSGEIQVLVSIRCLDEGVDVPSTEVAFILASSTNPREFVQRRGRILRLSEGKTKAIIYDFLVVPSIQQLAENRDIGTAILRREMPRFAEFSSAAANEFSAREKVWGILNSAGMLHLLEQKPWEVYHQVREKDWENDGED